jgi:colanic acid/amylovoran biosynthesis glycosyltransferase
MKLMYITSSLPYGMSDVFFIPEIKHLLSTGHVVIIVPKLPSGILQNREVLKFTPSRLIQPLFSLEILWTAILVLIFSPLVTIQALCTISSLHGGVVNLLRNLTLIPKSLWLAKHVKALNIEHIHATWSITEASMAMIIGKLNNIPWSFTAHRGDIVRNNLLIRKSKEASFVRFISNRSLEMAIERGVNQNFSNCIVSHLGVEIESPIENSKIESIPLPITPVILCPASLIPVKGHKYLLEAAKILQSRGTQFQIWLAGDGPLREILKKQSEQLSLGSSIQFCGLLPREELMDLYRKKIVSITVLPSIESNNGLHEGIPVSLMEALSFGISVISTRTGGIPELVNDECGILVEPGNAKVLADAIERLLSSPEMLKKLGQNGQRRIKECFSVDSTTAQLVSLFQNFT